MTETRTACLSMRKEEFGRFASELRKRGFSEKLPLAPALLKPDNENARIYSLKELGMAQAENAAIFNLAENVGEYVLRHPDSVIMINATAPLRKGESLREMPDDRTVDVKAMFSRGWNANFQLLFLAFGNKSHMMSEDQYRAFLLLTRDVDRMLTRVEALNGELVKLGGDGRIMSALDAMTVRERLSVTVEALKAGIPDVNIHKSGVVAHLNAIAGDFHQEFEETLHRIQTSPEICAAMQIVAESGPVSA